MQFYSFVCMHYFTFLSTFSYSSKFCSTFPQILAPLLSLLLLHNFYATSNLPFLFYFNIREPSIYLVCTGNSSMSLTAISSTTSSILLPLTCNFHSKRRISISTSYRVRANGAAKVEYTPWLIVGLGNPGNKYYGTRHNVGVEMIDQISEKEGIVLNTIQLKALIGLGSIGEVPVLLAKPQAYMNYSGESVGALAAYYKIPLRHILLVYDEMNLPNGVLRLQQKGGHGHHSGVKSVMSHVDGRREFPRLCIGIGNPPGAMDMKAFLLQKFSPSERKQIYAALEQGVEAVRTLVFNGFNDSITRFNLGQKYKYHKV